MVVMARMVLARYQADNGDIHPIRLRPETNTVVSGTIPAGNVTNNLFAKVTKSKRQFGISPRQVVIARGIGTGADTATVYATLPICEPSDWDSDTGAWQVSSNVSYKGATWMIVSRIPENSR